MALALRLVAVCFALPLVCAPARAQLPLAPEPHLALDELVKEYKRHGLPLPPPHAELVRIERHRVRLTSPGSRMLGPKPPANRERHWIDDLNDLDKQSHVLAYRVPPPKLGGRPLYLIVGWFGIGLQELKGVEPGSVEATRLTQDALEWVVSRHGGYSLTFAVQCKALGWDDFATVLYARAREQFTEQKSDRSVRAELREIAWRFWAIRLTERGTDRKEVQRRLTALVGEEPTLRTKYNEWLLGSLDKTGTPRKSKPGTVEALIDDLTEYWEDPLTSKPYETEPAERAAYWKLAERGFDAVPALIEHVKDDRLTRAWAPGLNNFPSRHVTIGDLCSRLLHRLSDYQTGHRGVAFLDLPPHQDRARQWFEEAKKLGEEKWLLSRALRPANARAVGPYKEGAEPLIVWLIGVKYPARLPEVYRTLLKQPHEECPRDGYAREVVMSKLPREQKVALLEEGARGEGRFRRISAMEGLAQFDPEAFRKYLWYELIRLQTQHALVNWAAGELPYWVWSKVTGWQLWPESWTEARLARLAEVADDPTCWDALVALGNGGYFSGKLAMIEAIGAYRPPDQKDPHRAGRIYFLLRFINDTKLTERLGGGLVAVSDLAADRLANVLHIAGGRLDSNRGPFSCLLIRAVVAKAAAEELERLKK